MELNCISDTNTNVAPSHYLLQHFEGGVEVGVSIDCSICSFLLDATHYKVFHLERVHQYNNVCKLKNMRMSLPQSMKSTHNSKS